MNKFSKLVSLLLVIGLATQGVLSAPPEHLAAKSVFTNKALFLENESVVSKIIRAFFDSENKEGFQDFLITYFQKHAQEQEDGVNLISFAFPFLNLLVQTEKFLKNSDSTHFSQQLRGAIGLLNQAALPLTIDHCAKLIGISSAELLQLAVQNQINLKDAGVILKSKGRKPLDAEARKVEIRAAVKALKEAGQPATQSAVAEKMGMSRSVLSLWASGNEIDLVELGVEDGRTVDIESRKVEIRAAVNALKEAGQPATQSAVAEKMGMSHSSVLSLWASGNEIDLVELGVEVGEAKIESRKAKIRAAVKALKKVGQPATQSAVAEKMGMTKQALSNWASGNEIDLVELGVEDGRTVDIEARKVEIRAAVKALKKSGQPATQSAVAEKMGMSHSSVLSLWGSNNEIDLVALGVEVGEAKIEARKAKIRAAVKALKEAGQPATQSAVEKKMGMTQSALSKWASWNEIDLAVLGVEYGRITVDIESRKGEVRAAVKALKKAGQPATQSAVAEKMGMAHSSVLSNWASNNEIDLAELGVEVGEAKIEARKSEIRKAVKELKEAGQSATQTAVAEKMGMSPSALWHWASSNEIDLAELGVEYGRVTVDVEARKGEVRAAVKALKKAGQPATQSAVAEKMGMAHSSVLSNWASGNEIDLAALGVEVGEAKIEARKVEIRAAVEALKEAGQKPKLQNVAEKIGLKYDALYRWASGNEIDLAALGVEDGRGSPVDVEARKKEIKEVARFLKKNGFVPYLENVAVLVKGICSPVLLYQWAWAHEVNLHELGVAKRPRGKPEQVQTAIQQFQGWYESIFETAI